MEKVSAAAEAFVERQSYNPFSITVKLGRRSNYRSLIIWEYLILLIQPVSGPEAAGVRSFFMMESIQEILDRRWETVSFG